MVKRSSTSKKFKASYQLGNNTYNVDLTSNTLWIIGILLAVLISVNKVYAEESGNPPLSFSVAVLDSLNRNSSLRLNGAVLPANSQIGGLVVFDNKQLLPVGFKLVQGTIRRLAVSRNGNNRSRDTSVSSTNGAISLRLPAGHYSLTGSVELADGRKGTLSDAQFIVKKLTRGYIPKTSPSRDIKLSLVNSSGKVVIPDLTKSTRQFLTEQEQEGSSKDIRLNVKIDGSGKKDKKSYFVEMISTSGAFTKQRLAMNGSSLQLDVGSLLPGFYLVKISATGSNGQVPFAVLVFIPRFVAVPTTPLPTVTVSIPVTQTATPVVATPTVRPTNTTVPTSTPFFTNTPTRTPTAVATVPINTPVPTTTPTAPSPSPSPSPSVTSTPNSLGKVPMFIVSGHGGRTVTSCDDGRTWIANHFYENRNEDHSPFTEKGFVYGNGLFVQLIGWGAPTTVKISKNGIDWMRVTGITGGGGIAFINASGGNGGTNIGTFMTIGGYGGCSRSTNGITWNSCLGPNYNHVLREAGGGESFIGAGGEIAAQFSFDSGGSWRGSASCSMAIGFGNLGQEGGFASGNGVNVVVSSNGTFCQTSDKGITWKTGNLGIPISGKAVFTGGKFWAPYGNGAFTSSDGLNWTRHTFTPATTNIHAIARGDTGTYVGIERSYNDPVNRYFRSLDGGITWSPISGPGGTSLRRIAFGYGEPSKDCPLK